MPHLPKLVVTRLPLQDAHGQFRADGRTVLKLCWSLLHNAKHIECIYSTKYDMSYSGVFIDV